MGILRFLFAIYVLLSHSTDNKAYIFPAPQAVLSFFVISGFYMALILDGKYKSKMHFYINRALRIFPIYWLILFITVAFGLIKTQFNIGDGDNAVLHYFRYSAHLQGVEVLTEGANFIIRNLTLIVTKDYFTMKENLAAGYLILYQAWSLQIELIFYLLVPFILSIKRNFLFFVVVYFVLFYGIFSPLTTEYHSLLTFKFFNYLIYFLLGICAYKYLYLKIKKIRPNKWFYAVLFTLVSYLIFYQIIPGRIVEQRFSVSLIYYLFLAAAIPFSFAITKNNKFDRFIGELSYPIYISHIFIAKIYLSLTIINSSFLNVAFIAIGSTIFSIILIKYVQLPIDNFRHSKLRK